jgi:hypothetical protein
VVAGGFVVNAMTENDMERKHLLSLVVRGGGERRGRGIGAAAAAVET